MFAEHRNLKLCFAVQNVPLHFFQSNRITNVERFNTSDRSRSTFWTLNQPLRDVVQDLYCTDPTQETRARSCRLYGFYSANDLDDTGQESCGDRSSVRCVKISFALAETTRNTARAAWYHPRLSIDRRIETKRHRSRRPENIIEANPAAHYAAIVSNWLWEQK